MKNSLNLSTDETLLVQSALETYAESEHPNVAGFEFPKQLRIDLVRSVLQKLKNISVLTYFSGKEKAILLSSVLYILQLSEIEPIDADDEKLLLSISSKLSSTQDEPNLPN